MAATRPVELGVPLDEPFDDGGPFELPANVDRLRVNRFRGSRGDATDNRLREETLLGGLPRTNVGMTPRHAPDDASVSREDPQGDPSKIIFDGSAPPECVYPIKADLSVSRAGSRPKRSPSPRVREEPAARRMRTDFRLDAPAMDPGSSTLGR